MKSALIILLLLVANLGFAQLTFGEHIIADDSILPRGVTHIEFADIDGDGDQDMIISSEYDDKIAWFENLDGLGAFGMQNIVSNDIRGPQFVRSADIEGDGDIDLVVVAEGSIVGFYNVGNGEFDRRIILDSSAQDFWGVRNTLLADMNQDGKLDIVLTSTSNEMWYFENLDNQGNYDGKLISDGHDPNLNIGDIDNDGDLDIVSRSGISARLVWHENKTEGFETHEFFIEGLAALYQLGDMDNDGDLDLAILSDFNSEQYVSWLEFDGNFDQENIVVDGLSDITSISVADVKGDGYSDIFVNATSLSEVLWYENFGIIDPDTAEPIWNSSVTNTDLIYMEDINNDSYPDLITGDMKWFVFDPNTDSYVGGMGLESYSDEAYDVLTLDVDNDGDLDVISASNGDGRIGWFENVNSDGEFDLIQNLITDEVRDVTDIHLADIDSDSYMDIVGTVWEQKLVFWIRNNGDATFGDILVIDSDLKGANSVVASDMDNDGDLDIIAVGSGPFFDSQDEDERITLYTNLDGGGIFDNGINLMTGISASTLKLADIDGDTDLDIVYSAGIDGIQYMENFGGTAMFSSSQKISSDFVISTILEVSDLDLDGDVDVITTSFTPDRIIILRNEGSGNFNQEEIPNFSCTAINASDIDQDGDVDLLIGVFGFELPLYDFGYLENVGEGIDYVYHTIDSLYNTPPNNIAVADIDDDGDLDVISASISDDKIAWYENYDPVSTSDILTFQFTISPVPVTTSLKIESDMRLNKAVIYNIEGKFQLLSHDVSKIDVSSLVSGMYIIQVVDVDGNSIAKKFVKE